MTAERLFSALSDMKTGEGNSLTAIPVASSLQTKLGMKQLGVDSSSLVVDSMMAKLSSFVKAFVTAEEAAVIFSRPPI